MLFGKSTILAISSATICFGAMNTLASAVASRPVGLEVLELRELSLAINAPESMVIVVSRSHSRVERIVNEAEAINSHIHMIAGGFHLVTAR